MGQGTPHHSQRLLCHHFFLCTHAMCTDTACPWWRPSRVERLLVEGWPADWHGLACRNDSQAQAATKSCNLYPGLDAAGFCHGRNSSPIIRPERPPLHVRSQVWGGGKGVGAKPEVFGLLSLCSVLHSHWLFTWFSFFGFCLGCEVILFSELIPFHVT